MINEHILMLLTTTILNTTNTIDSKVMEINIYNRKVKTDAHPNKGRVSGRVDKTPLKTTEINAFTVFQLIIIITAY